MAKTRQEWQALISNNETLSGFSNSAVAEWLEIRDFVITLLIAFEAILEFFKKDVDTTIENKQPGSIYWWPLMVKEFQNGDSLIVDNGVVKYATINPANKIITHVSVKERETGAPNIDTVLEVKVAKKSGTNTVPLTAPELDALKVYIQARRSPGVSFIAVSRPADVVKYALTVKYDVNYSLTDVQTGIEDALDTFKNNLDFDAVFYKSQLIAAIKGVPGVVSVVVVIDMTLNSGAETVTNLAEEKELPAGYFVWDVTSTISLIPV